MKQHLERAYRVGAVAVVGGLVAILGACSTPGETESSEGTEGGVLRFALDRDVICLDPRQSIQVAQNNAMRQVVDSLVDQDPDTGEIVPWLAEEWKVNEDATEYTFTLGHDATFSDGTPVDAAAVKANFDANWDLGAVSSRGGTYLAGYEGTTVVDEHTVRLDFSEPNVPFLQASSTVALGILAPSTLEVDPAVLCTGEGLIASGPFTIDEYEANQRLALAKREGYDWPSALAKHSGEAFLDGIEFLILPEASVRVGGLTSDQVDTAMSIPSDSIGQLEAQNVGILTRVNPGIVSAIAFNMTREIFHDEKVRHALALATDAGETAAMLGPVFDVPTSVLSPTTDGYTDMSKHIKYDPDAAEKLMDELGWEKGADGMRSIDGVPVEFSIVGAAGPEFEQPLELMQAQWARVGVQLNLNVLPLNERLVALKQHTYDLHSTLATSKDPSILRSNLHSEGTNYLQFTPDFKPLDELLEEQGTLTGDARQKVLDELQEILVGEYYVIPQRHAVQIQAVVSAVKDLRFDADARLVAYDTYFEAAE